MKNKRSLFVLMLQDGRGASEPCGSYTSKKALAKGVDYWIKNLSVLFNFNVN